MNWMQPLDLYCERTDASFWAEPLNAISNIAFIMAGLYGLMLWRKKSDQWLLVMSLLAFSVGVGSFLFHTFANNWSHQADVIPIGILMAFFFIFTLLKLVKFSLQKSAVLTLAFLVVSLLAMSLFPKDVLNGSLGYLPGICVLVLLTVYMIRVESPYRKHFIYSSFSFFGSLVFRTIDQSMCAIFPYGTHFLWHGLNGLLIGLLITIVYRYSCLTITEHSP